MKKIIKWRKKEGKAEGKKERKGGRQKSGKASRTEEVKDEVEGRRPPGRPKKTWMGVVEGDMRILNITEDVAMGRTQWRRLISSTTQP